MVAEADSFRQAHPLFYAAIGALAVGTKPADVITVVQHGGRRRDFM